MPMTVETWSLSEGRVPDSGEPRTEGGASLDFGLAGPGWRTRVIRARILCPYQAVTEGIGEMGGGQGAAKG